MRRKYPRQAQPGPEPILQWLINPVSLLYARQKNKSKCSRINHRMKRCAIGITLNFDTRDEMQFGKTSVDRCYCAGRGYIGDCINHRGTNACGMLVEQKIMDDRYCLHQTGEKA